MWSSAYEWASEAMSFSDAGAAPKNPYAPKPGPSTSMAEEALPILRRACERELPDAELLRFLRAKEWASSVPLPPSARPWHGVASVLRRCASRGSAQPASHGASR